MHETKLNMKELAQHLDEAEDHLSKALDLEPLDPGNHIVLAWDIIAAVREAIELDVASRE